MYKRQGKNATETCGGVAQPPLPANLDPPRRVGVRVIAWGRVWSGPTCKTENDQKGLHEFICMVVLQTGVPLFFGIVYSVNFVYLGTLIAVALGFECRLVFVSREGKARFFGVLRRRRKCESASS